MSYSKESIKVLKLANKAESVTSEDICKVLEKSVHQPYVFEQIDFLEKDGLIVLKSERRPEGWELLTIRITPAGQAVVEAYTDQLREKWITRGTAIAALIISIIALLKP